MAFTDPQQNIQHLNLREGMSVADFGTGSGHYALLLSRVVGESGRVYAVDIQRDLLARLKNQATQERLCNIMITWGDIESLGGSKLREGILDAVVLSNMLFQVEQDKVVAQEVKRVLKPGGRVLVIDWTDSFGYMGPRPEDIVPLDKVRELFSAEGFTEEETFDAGDHHYGIVFKKA